jgi:hypothetical protein
MGAQLAIIRRSPKAILPEFNRLVLDRAMTIDELREWLASHGVAVSREAVWNYSKALRAGNDPRVWLHGVGDGLKEQAELASLLTRLIPTDVSLLLAMARIMAGRRPALPSPPPSEGV